MKNSFTPGKKTQNIRLFFLGTNHNLEVQQTRSSTECAAPQGDYADMHLSAQISKVTSPLSTNSSDHEYTGIDRSQFNDEEYGIHKENK